MKHRLLVCSLSLSLVLSTAMAQNSGRDPKFIRESLLKQGIVFANNEARMRADSSDVSVPPTDSVECDVLPVPVSKANPEYPEDALDSRIQGNVYVKMWVDRTGKVKRVRLVRSDDPILNASAIAASFQWRFKPATRAGRPIDFWLPVPFRFAIAQ